jgi:RND family efflux transporter MFP subunit
MIHRITVVALAIGLLAGCEEPVRIETDKRQLVSVIQAEQGTLVQRLAFSSTLRPVNRARLAFQAPGIVDSRPVELGQVVRKGELLATLDNPELGPAQKAAAATLQESMTRRDQARRDLTRLESLQDSGAVGEDAVEQKRAELDALNSAVNAAEANLAATGERLEDARLVAPFDGVIYSIFVEPGEFVAGGQVLMSIGGPERLELEVLLPASLVGQLQHGTLTEVRAPQLAGLSWPGQVVEVSSIGDPATGLFPAVVEVLVDASGTPLRAGMLAQAWFEHVAREGVIVPMSAIVDPVGGDPRVFRVENGLVQTTHVDIVASSEARVAVIPREGGSLARGDLVVTEGHRALTNGQPVRTAL